jgi:hypothetical protein
LIQACFIKTASAAGQLFKLKPGGMAQVLVPGIGITYQATASGIIIASVTFHYQLKNGGNVSITKTFHFKVMS